ncbi:MAG TPA: hypothetical protein VMF70_03685 [Gemmatimonadales bacterium]|nr:hypothetical protein [Gemmatimonadales bacterium]
MTYAVVPLAVAVLCIWLGRRLLTVVVIFAYLSIEGLLKLLSDYNRIVHVGIDLIVLGVATVWILEAVVGRRAQLPRLPWTGLIVAYVAWIVLETLNPYSPGLLPSLAAFKTHVTMIPLYFIGAAVVRSRRDVVLLCAALSAVALVPFVAALLQYAAGPQSVLDLSPRFWQNISFYHEWRPFGTSAVPGGASVFAFLATPLALLLLLAPEPRPWMRWLGGITIALAAGTFIVSGVRQMIMGCALAILVMAALLVARGRSRGLVGVAFVGLAGAAAYAGIQAWLTPISTEQVKKYAAAPDIWRERNVVDRLLTMTKTGTYFEARQGAPAAVWYRAVRYPFGAGLGRTGSGAGTFMAQITADPRSAAIEREVGWSDNFFADEIVEAGIPGVVIWTIILVGLVGGAVRLARRSRDPFTASAAAAIAGLFFTYFVISWGSQPLLANPTLAYFWLLAGVLAALRRMEGEAAAEADGAEDRAALAAP